MKELLLTARMMWRLLAHRRQMELLIAERDFFHALHSQAFFAMRSARQRGDFQEFWLAKERCDLLHRRCMQAVAEIEGRRA